MSGDDPSESSSVPTDNLVLYLAIGRLACSPEGELLPEKHRLVAHNFSRKDDPDPDWTKSIKAHLKAVMKRAGHKLTPGKRIRLKDDNQQYEVHILTDEQDGDSHKTLVFFAVTVPNFPKYHSVPALLRDLKGGFYSTVDAGTLWNGGSVQRACQPYFTRIMTHYGQSHLRSVQVKVEQVKNVMSDSVKKALNSVEHLEEMDEKAELFEDQSKKFHKRAEAVKVQEKGKYYKLMCLLATAVLIVVIYFIVVAVQKIKGNSDSGSGVASSTGGGFANNTGLNMTSSSSTGYFNSNSSSTGYFSNSSSSSTGLFNFSSSSSGL